MRCSVFRIQLALVFYVLVAGMACAAQDAWQPDTQVGDFRFNLPDGWKRVESKSGPMLVPKDLPKGGVCFIEFIRPEELQGDFRSWFNAGWAQWQKQFKVQQAGKVTAEHNPNGFNVLRIDARVSNQALGYSEFVFRRGACRQPRRRLLLGQQYRLLQLPQLPFRLRA